MTAARHPVAELIQKIESLKTSRNYWMKLARLGQRIVKSQQQQEQKEQNLMRLARLAQRATSSKQEQIRAKEEAKRLDFLIKNQAFVIDEDKGFQLYTQDTDENFIPLSGSGYFSTPRAAIDEARRRAGDVF